MFFIVFFFCLFYFFAFFSVIMMSMSTTMFQSSLNTLRQIEFNVWVLNKIAFPFCSPWGRYKMATAIATHFEKYCKAAVKEWKAVLLEGRAGRQAEWLLYDGVNYGLKLVFYANCIIKHKNIVELFISSSFTSLALFSFFSLSLSLSLSLSNSI